MSSTLALSDLIRSHPTQYPAHNYREKQINKLGAEGDKLHCCLSSKLTELFWIEKFSKTMRAKEKDRTSVKFQVKTTHSHNFGTRLHTALPNSPNLTS